MPIALHPARIARDAQKALVAKLKIKFGQFSAQVLATEGIYQMLQEARLENRPEEVLELLESELKRRLKLFKLTRAEVKRAARAREGLEEAKGKLYELENRLESVTTSIHEAEQKKRAKHAYVPRIGADDDVTQ